MSQATQSPSPAAEPATDGQEPRTTHESRALGHAVGGGMSWMVVATIGTRAATFAAQILLGWWLLPRDFALYGVATALAGFMMICRDMSTGTLLVQRGREAYRSNDGAAFWLAFTYNIIVASVGSIAAFPLANRVYNQPELAWMLVVMLWALPIGAVGNNLFARLRLDLRFKAFSWQMALSGLFRQVAMIVLARMGFGPMSFALPMLLNSIFDSVSLYLITREAPWTRPPQFDQWVGMIRQAVWLMVNSLANFAMDYGPFLVLGPIMALTLANEKAAYDIVGFYFFAYQITGQIGVMLAYNAMIVLVPALQRMKGEPERQRAAALRALRTLMFTGSICSLGLASIMGPLERILWQGKFAESVAAILIFGAFYPWRITFGLCTSVLMAQGAFRRLAVLSAFECIGLIAASAAAGFVSPSVQGIAWWTGGWGMFSRMLSTWYVFHKLGGRWTATVSAMVPAWLVALAAFGVAMWMDHRLQLGSTIAGNARVINYLTTLVGPERCDHWAAIAGNAAQLIVTGGMCAAVFVVLASLFLADDMRDMLRVMPARVRGPLLKLMRLD